MGIPYKDLKNTPDDELVKLHDLEAESSQAGTNYYLEELRHRELVGERQVIGMRLKAMVGQPNCNVSPDGWSKPAASWKMQN